MAERKALFLREPLIAQPLTFPIQNSTLPAGGHLRFSLLQCEAVASGSRKTRPAWCRRAQHLAEESTYMKLERYDHVLIKNLGVEGQVIEVDTRSIVVRYKKRDGELVEHRFAADDLEYLRKAQLE